jgi:hypothetical protein
MRSSENLVWIEFRLRGDLEAARELHDDARHQLQCAVNEVPSGIPSPDGALRIRVAATAEKQARQAYMAAMRRFYEFIVEGKVPEDIESTGASG